jgi:hypothetical protein
MKSNWSCSYLIVKIIDYGVVTSSKRKLDVSSSLFSKDICYCESSEIDPVAVVLTISCLMSKISSIVAVVSIPYSKLKPGLLASIQALRL